MKIRGKDNNLQHESLELLRQRIQEKRTEQQRRHTEHTDRVSLGIGQTIRQELDPEKIATDRQARIEELKALVRSGKYSAPSEAVARAVGEEITMTILTESVPEAEDE